MQNKSTGTAAAGEALMENMQNMVKFSMGVYKNMFETFLDNGALFTPVAGAVGKGALAPLKAIFNSGDCCPPAQACPAHCIAQIHRQAMQGERIMVPFSVTNTCSSAKTYKVGVRELVDQDNKTAPQQPQLNKKSVVLQPNSGERILMTIDLANFSAGTYSADIVVREKDVNQNICFTLEVSDHEAVIARPGDEKQYRLKWQSWKDHYYCEPPAKRDNPNS